MERIAENIAELYSGKKGVANRRAIFKHYRGLDESHLYPIRNRFNVTKREIQHESKLGDALIGLELCLYLESEISRIVNERQIEYRKLIVYLFNNLKTQRKYVKIKIKKNLLKACIYEKY